MEKVFLHIGIMKTATTFFQEVIFPRLNNTLFLPKTYIGLNHSFEKLKYTDDSLLDEDEIRKEFDKFSNRRVLISSETLVGNPLYNNINRTCIAKRLKKLFPNATIILFIRGQFDVLRSFYKLYVHEGPTVIQPITQFYSYPVGYDTGYKFEDIARSPDTSNYKTYYRNKIHIDNFKYFEIVKLYTELFDDVRVYLFEDFINNPKQFVHSLENLLEDKVENLEDIDFNIRYRKSITNLETEHKIFYNKLNILTNKKIFTSPLFFIYKRIHRKSNSFESFFDKIQKYYVENNNFLIKNYPEIGIQNYPEKYQF